MQYTVEKVANDVGQHDTQYGTNLDYTVKFVGNDNPVTVSQKPETPAPKPGDIMNGNINSTKFGYKFKKEFAPKPSFGGDAKATGSKPVSDNFTMFLAYAKDIAVAMLQKDCKLDGDAFNTALQLVIAGGYELYDNRPDAKDKAAVDTVFGDSEPLPDAPVNIDWGDPA